MSAVSRQTHEALARISVGRVDALESILELREAQREVAGLDERTSGLVKIAVLVALDAPPASYASHVASAIEGGATAEDILGLLRAVAPHVGGPRVVAAAPEIMLALGLTLPDTAD